MAFCSNCGEPLGEGAGFCTKCGAAAANDSGNVQNMSYNRAQNPAGGGNPQSQPLSSGEICAKIGIPCILLSAWWLGVLSPALLLGEAGVSVVLLLLLGASVLLIHFSKRLGYQWNKKTVKRLLIIGIVLLVFGFCMGVS